MHLLEERASPQGRPSLKSRNFFRSLRELILLAPSGEPAPRLFRRCHADAERCHGLLSEMQRLRGAVYLRDGAIPSAQIAEGRHRSAGDPESWHLLILDGDGHVCGCSRYREHPFHAGCKHMLVSKAAQAQCPRWGAKVASAVEQELALARRSGLSCAEVGGWALSEEVRGTSEAVRMVLTTYRLGQALGGGVGIGTATHRNSSASILRRLGARPLEHDDAELPSYRDPQYLCEMEILRFYFWEPNPRYAAWIAEIRAELPNTRVIADCEAKPERRFVNLGWDFAGMRPALAAGAA